jgi:tRNA threonylcarbamoyladenosine biosynthesis protein TsaB
MSRVAIAIETSGKDGSAALCVDGVVVMEEIFAQGMRHASGLMVAIDRMCTAHAVKPQDVNEVYVSIGPGSFTGLRVGVTAAKTIAWANSCRGGAKIVAVPSLGVIAQNAPADATEIIVMLDAKRGQVFGERFSKFTGETPVPPDTGKSTFLCHPEKSGRLLDPIVLLTERSGKVWVLGEGIAHHRDAIAQCSEAIVCDEALWRPRASVVARLGLELASEGRFVDAMKLVPVYVRIPEPEEKRLAALQNSKS